MAVSDSVKECFKILASDPEGVITELPIAASSVKDCCFRLPALAESGVNTNRFKNDFSSPIWWFNEGFASASMELEKLVGSTWTVQDTLTNDDYGTFYGYGFEVNDLGEKLMGYSLDWNLVLNAFDQGCYRIKVTATDIFANDTNRYSFEYELKTYTEFRANRTVRFDAANRGIYGNLEDDSKINDLGSIEWTDQVRLPKSKFGFAKSELTKEFNRYNDGTETWIESKQLEKYIFEGWFWPEPIHKYLQFYIFNSDQLLVTDFNKNNANKFIEKPVSVIGPYEPIYPTNGTLYYRVNSEFQQANSNHWKKRN